MKPSSAKQKGRNFQKQIRDLIIANFPLMPDDVRSTSMGASGVDILLSPAARKFMPFDIECKNVERTSIWQCWEQTISNSNQYKPLLFMKRNNQEPLAVLRAHDLFELLKKVSKDD